MIGASLCYTISTWRRSDVERLRFGGCLLTTTGCRSALPEDSGAADQTRPARAFPGMRHCCPRRALRQTRPG